MEMRNRLNRRKFLQASAAGLTLAAASRNRVLGANDRLKTALIGCGVIGQQHLAAMLRHQREGSVEIAAVCDVFERRAQAFQDRIWTIGGNAKRFQNHRELLDSVELDYLTIATPEHWHARQSLDALEKGLHVYCEKPLAHKLEDNLEIQEKVGATGLKLQVGVQGMSDDSYSSARDAILNGKIGAVVHAQTEYVRRYNPESGPWRTGVDSALEKPEDLDWEEWLGPAPSRAWDPHRYFEWRCYRDYSGGVATDLFVHRICRIMKACSLGIPSRVAGLGGIMLWDDGRELPDHIEMLAQFEAVEKVTPGMTLHVLGAMANQTPNAHMIRGSEATLVFTPTGWEIREQRGGQVIEAHQKSGGEDIYLHHQNLHAAIRGQAELHCPADLGGNVTIVAIGANQSWFDNKMVQWDPQRKRWA